MPGTKVVDLTGSITTAGEQSFTPASTTTLSTSTKYFVVLSTSGASGVDIQRTASDDEDSGGSTGWEIANNSVFSTTSGSTWTSSGSSIEIVIKGTIVSGTNNPPTVANTIPDQTATVGTAFSYVFPANTFSDADTSDTLTYTATKAAGTDLPLWLAFAAGTRTFSGTPTDAGMVALKVTASDGNGGSVSDTFDITVSAAADTTPPTLISATVVPNGSIMRFQFSETLDGSNRPPVSAFTVTAGGNTITNNSTSQVPGSSDGVALSFSPPYIRQGQAVVVTYTDPTAGDDANAIQDTAGNDAATFTTGMNGVPAVTNNSTVNTPATGAPAITGTAQVGQTLTAGTTAIMDANGLTTPGYTYQWIRVATDNTETNIASATASTYTLVAADLGTTIKVTVSFTDDASNAETLTSVATAAATPPPPPNIPPEVATAIPDQPATVGTAFSYAFPDTTFADADGDTLTYAATKADGATLPTWLAFADGTRTFSGTPQTADVGTVSVKVTASDGNGGSVSDDFDITVSAAANNLATGAPTITGTAQVGQTLTAGTTGIMDADGLTSVSYAYQWIRVDGGTETNISGATASAYTLVAADQGTTIKVKVSFTDDLNNPETLTSAATAAVSAAATSVPGAPTGLTATASGTTAINLSWTAPGSTGGSAITGYNIEVSPNGTSGWTDQVANTNSTATTYAHTGLAVGDTRHYRVSAINTNGAGTASNVANATTGQTTVPPTLTSATVFEGGVFINLRFSENMLQSNLPDATTFTVTAAGSAVTVDYVLLAVAPAPLNAFWILVRPTIDQGQVVVVTYTDPTAGNDAYAIQNTAGNDAATFTTGMNGVPAVTNNATVNTPATGAPTITGTAQVGQMLTAVTTGIMDDDGLTSVSYTYQWIRVPTDNTEAPIPEATASTYTLVAADLGTTIKVRVSFTDDLNNPETLTSAATTAVSAANTPPSASDGTVTTNEDSAHTFTASEFSFSDADGDTLSNVRIVTLPASGKGTLALSGTPVTANQVVAATNIGTLAYTPPANANGTGYASFTFKVSDGTAESAAAYTMTITVTAVNDAPTVATAIPDQPATVGTAFSYPFPDTTFADADGDTLTYMATKDGGAALPTWLTFAATTRTFSGTPQTADVGTVSVKVTASDGNGGSVSDEFDITVSAAANNLATGAPTITGTATVGQTLTADTTGIMDDDGLTSVSYAYQWIQVDGGTETNISGATASAYTPVTADQGKMIKVKVSFTDDASNPETLTSTATAAVTAATNTPATDAPPPPPTNTPPEMATRLVDQEATTGASFTYVIPADAFTDADGDPLTYATVLSDGGPLPAWLTFDPATRTFTGTPGPGDGGPVRVTVTASDGTATMSDEFTLTVTVRNTPPEVANPLADQATPVDASFTYVIPADAFTDADGDPLRYAAATRDGGGLPAWLAFNAATRTFTGTPGPGDSGTVRVTVTANDGTATVSDEFALRVLVVVPSTLRAWTSRFGRTVATHVTDAVDERLRALPGEDSHVTVGGYRLPLGRQAAGAADPDATEPETAMEPETATKPEPATDRLASLLTGLVGRALGLAAPQGGDGTDPRVDRLEPDPRLGQSQPLQLPTIRLRDVLLGSSFRLALGDDEAAPGHRRLTAWGRVAGTQFNGRDGALTLDGNVLTGTVGVDSAWDRWLAGVAVSHSLGGGSFTGDGDGDFDSSTLTSIHPYLRYAVNERVEVWSVLGYGWGDMTLEPGTGGTLETDTTLLMGSFGGRGILLSAPDNAGFQLAARTDAMLTRTTSGAVAGLAATDAEADRLRLVLEGTREVTWPGGQRVTPTVELGVRHDSGDAETGFGLELGGRVHYTDPSLGLTIEAAVRGLLAHEDSDYKEWGASGTIRIDPGPTGQGFSLTLAPTWGAASSGIESLWSRQTTAGLAPQGTRSAPTGRLNAEVSYGVAAPFGTGLLTPYVGTVLTDGAARTYRVGTRLKLTGGWTTGVTLSLEGQRQEPVGSQPINQGLQFQAAWGF